MIEFVLVGRCDDFGGNFIGRLLENAQFNARVLTETKIDYRFTFVEWNSPQKLIGSLAKRFVKEVPHSRAFVVGPELHGQVCDNPHMVIMEFFAKNVALRRSTSHAILCTNADIRLGRVIVESLLTNHMRIKHGVLWRALRRIDFRTEAQVSSFRDLDFREYWLEVLNTKPPAYTQAAGDFQLASRSWWQQLRGYDETIRFAKIHKDRRFCAQTRLSQGTIHARGDVFHTHHGTSYLSMPKKERYAKTSHNGPEYNKDAGLPYANLSTWGLSWCDEKLLSENVVRLIAPPKFRLRSGVPRKLIVPETFRKSHRQKGVTNYNRANYQRNIPEAESWKSGCLRLEDEIAGALYTLGLTSFQQVKALFPQLKGDFFNQRETIQQSMVRSPECVLDVGCGRGGLSSLFASLNVPVIGVDPSPGAALLTPETVESWAGVERSVGYFQFLNMYFDEAVALLDTEWCVKPDTVVLVESLEHIPRKTFQSAYPIVVQWLKESQGLFVVTNWLRHHPTPINPKKPWCHVTQVDDAYFDWLAGFARKVVFRYRSHLVLEF